MSDASVRNKQRGFSLMEMVIALGIIATVGSLIVPLALDRVEDARISTALESTETFREALAMFKTDVGQVPNKVGNATCKYLLFGGSGAKPLTWASGINWGTPGDSAYNHFTQNIAGYDEWDEVLQVGWKGPYLDKTPLDPWQHYYHMSVNKDDHYRRWVVSAGPNGEMETDDASNGIGGDDIGVRIR